MKKFIKIYVIATLCFTALSIVAGIIDFVIKSLRALVEHGAVKSSIPVTGSSIETASHWLVNLWISPITAIIIGVSLVLVLTWLYVNFKAIKKEIQKYGRDFLGYE